MSVATRLQGAETNGSVGIAVPVLNAQRFVRTCLESLVALRIPFQAIIQDGGSRDGTLSIVEEVVGSDPRFDIVREQDHGQADALNRAWSRLATDHEFLTWVNADDLVHPHGLAGALAVAQSRPDAAAVYGGFLVIDEDGLVIEYIQRPPRLRRIDLLYVDSLVPGVATLCRTSMVQKVGMFDTQLHYALDHDLFLRLTAAGKLVGVLQPTFSFRWHRGSKTAGQEATSQAEAQEVNLQARRLDGAAASFASLTLRSRYRFMKMLGAHLPHEGYGTRSQQ